jgi:flagellar protein FliL
MELTLVFDGAADSSLARDIHQDFFAYMRTVKLRQIETASGFQHLKADLRERARIRSGGRATDILVTTFLYE